jgi:hypothetical protein
VTTIRWEAILPTIGFGKTDKWLPRGSAEMKDYDIFLSYKSEDVCLARLIAEQLLARGVVVWFAEFTMRLKDAICPEPALEEGAKRSRFGLLITNDRFSQSEFTRLEAELLLAHCGEKQLLELRIPDQPMTHSKMPSLAGVPPDHVLAWKKDQVQTCQQHVGEVLHAIKAKTDLEFDPSYKEATEFKQSTIYYNEFHHYSVDVGGWGEPKEGVADKLLFLYGNTTLCNSRVEWQIRTEPGFFLELRPLPVPGEIIDDRVWLRRIRESAEANLRRVNSGCFAKVRKAHWGGAHLLFKGGYSHFGLTYRAIDDRGEKCWVRGYTLVFPIGSQQLSAYQAALKGEAPSALGNIVFTFVFFFYGSFRQLMKYTKYMDRMVHSLKWQRVP